MFSTSNASSPQTAPTTPESISNNSDDYNGGGGSSNNEWGTNHDSDAWPSGHHDWNHSTQNSDNLNAHGTEWSNGGMGWVNNEWANTSNDWSAGLGLGFLNTNVSANMSDVPSDEQLANINGNPECAGAMPLHDLIDDSLLSNSPVATVGTVPNHIINTAWLNRNSSGNNLALNTNGIGLGMTPSPVTSPTSVMSHKSSLAPHPSSSISLANSQLNTASISRNPSFSQLANQHQMQPPTSADPTTLFSPFPSASIVGGQHLGMGRHSLGSSTESTGLNAARPPSGLNESGAGLFVQAAQPRSMYRLTVHDVPHKSRVETQVRLRIDLDDITASSALNGPRRPPEQWKFIRVPKTASVKTRNVKGQCEPDQSTVLTLSASIYCATNAAYKDKPVPCCENCQKREEKRNNKKASSYTGAHGKGAAARGSGPSRHGTAPSSKNVTPATSESEFGGPHAFSGYPYDLTNGFAGAGPSDGNYVSPIDFTCQQMLDFTGGSAQLCFRIICYCRHYKEKTGFIVRLTLKDFAGYTVGEVRTPAIMIMDDHKSTGKPTPAHTADEDEVDSSAHARRRKRTSRTEEDEDDLPQAVHTGGVGAIRNKPRPTRMTALTRANGSSSKPVPSGSGTSHAGSGVVRGTASESPLATTAPSSPSGFSPPPTTGTVTVKTEMEGVQFGGMPLFPQSQPQVQRHPNSGLSSPLSAAMSSLPMPSMVHSVTGFANPAPLPPPPNPFPNITRLVPNSGPTTGGIEVILLGANFSPDSLAGCYVAFGHQFVAIGNASNAGMVGMGMDQNGVVPGAQVLSENTLHCTLPPSQVSGPVTVKLLGVPLPPGQTEADAERLAPIFTYTEEGDRDLMMKALQILGLRNGQMQDARSIAMNIIHSNTQQGGLMNISNAGNDPSYMPMNYSMNSEASAPKKIEELVINVLRSAQNPETGVIKDVSVAHSPTGQTLLHLSAAMGLSNLTRALINWGAEVNLQDRNGFTPVHFACFYGRLDCINILVRVGRAHLEGKDVRGRTPFEVSKNNDVSFLLHDLKDEVETRQPRQAVASEFESGGEGDDEGDSGSVAWSDTDEENNSDYGGYKFGRTGTLRQRKSAPTSIAGAAAPQPMARRISRVNSFASNASHHSHRSRRSSTSRTGTPFAPEMTPLTSTQAPSVTTPTTPTPTAASVPLPEPVSPGSPWRLSRGVPNMPWPMQLPAGWQFPAVPGMPQFGLRRGSGTTGNDEGSDPSKKDEPTSEADAQAAQAQMFMWMMEYMRRTVGWDFNMLRQAQAASAGVGVTAPTVVADVDNDPPPYSPGGVGNPEEKLAQASQASQTTEVTQVNPITQVANAPTVVPAVPIVLEEPPSPLTLDSPFDSAVGTQDLFNVQSAHSQSGQQIQQVQPNVIVYPTSAKPRHQSHRHHSQRQQQEYIEDPKAADPTPVVVSKPSASSTAVVRRREKKQDKMLIYFWIPVLTLVVAWASYKSLHNVYRLLVPPQGPQEMPTRTNIEV